MKLRISTYCVGCIFHLCVFLIKLAIFFAYYKNHLYYTNVKFNIKADNKTITKKIVKEKRNGCVLNFVAT